MAYKVLPGDKLTPVIHTPLSSILRITDPEHILYDTRVHEAADPGLVESIREQGCTSALIVRPTPDGSGYELIEGRRRNAACLAVAAEDPAHDVAKKGVPVKVVRATDAEAFAIMCAFNGGGAAGAKPWTDMQRAELIQRSITVFGYSMSQAVKPFGIPETQGHQLLKLLKADTVVQDAVTSGDVGLSAAAILSVLPQDEQREVVKAAKDSGKKLTTDAAKRAVDPNGPVPPTTLRKIHAKLMSDTMREDLKLLNGASYRAMLAFLLSGDLSELDAGMGLLPAMVRWAADDAGVEVNLPATDASGAKKLRELARSGK